MKRIRAKNPSVRNRASTLWSEVVRMLNCDGSRLECIAHDGLCIYCRTLPATTADHVRPAGAQITRCTGSAVHSPLIMPCCASCNSSKGKRELGLWMVNKFGFTQETIMRICELTPVVEGPLEQQGQGVGQEELLEPEMLAVLRRICYQFCDELHSLVLDCKQRPDQWRQLMWSQE